MFMYELDYLDNREKFMRGELAVGVRIGRGLRLMNGLADTNAPAVSDEFADEESAEC